jgi:lipopolysaccharide/colanic/teichoic acid biosynthesis glycosyltransferase
MIQTSMPKRSFDLGMSALALLFCGPLLVICGLLVVLLSGRPIIFKQVRIGQNGRPFRLYKFRTMSVLKGTEKGAFDLGRAVRVTPIGRYLRRWKWDELPQLWNVVRGEMSIVGPRPEVGSWVAVQPERWKRILTARPGLTDPASIEFRHEEKMLNAQSDPEIFYKESILPRKLDLYERYVDGQSVAEDFFIILRTVRALFQVDRMDG